jgi:two-component system nitrate/nitrite response regulator NarL
MPAEIRVAILDDHQSIIDGYIYRISSAPHIKVVATALFGEELEPMLDNHAVDVLLLDISVPNSIENNNPYPILYAIPRLFQRHPRLNILVISMYTQRALVEALVNAGVSGYIFKDDQTSIQQLAKIVEIVAGGGIYFSQGAYRDLRGEPPGSTLTPRQLEALSLCAAQPDCDTMVLAEKLGITGSTMRNLLSGAYLRLGVRTRAAAIAKATQLGLFPPMPGSEAPAMDLSRKPVQKGK